MDNFLNKISIFARAMSPFVRAACYINELVQQEATNKPL